MGLVRVTLMLTLLVGALSDDCPYWCKCNNTIVDCRNQRIFRFPDQFPVNTETLLLDGNNISSIPNATLWKMIPNLRYFSFANNGVGDDPLNNLTFVNLKYLERLDISHDKIYNFPTYIPHTVKVLSIANNYMGPSFDFGGNTGFTSLDMSETSLMSVAYNDYSSLTNLTELYLRHNSITAVAAGSFRNNRLLQSLHLSYNQLTSDVITPATFEGLTQLQNLSLSGNPLTTVPFLPTSISSLHMHNTNIRTLHAGAFLQLQNLVELHISGEPYLSIESETFIQMNHLQMLNLDNATLSPDVLGPGMLYGLSSLEDLTLENSSVSAMEPSLFQYSEKIKHVNVRGMKLNTLNEKVFDQMSNNLTDFWIERNPFYCDCNLRWLRTMMMKSSINFGNTKNIICEGPEDVAGKTFDQLQPDDFLCTST